MERSFFGEADRRRVAQVTRLSAGPVFRSDPRTRRSETTAALVQLLKRKGHSMRAPALTDHDNVPVMHDLFMPGWMPGKERVRAVLGRLEDTNKWGAPCRCEPYGTRTRRRRGLRGLLLKGDPLRREGVLDLRERVVAEASLSGRATRRGERQGHYSD